MRCLLEMPTAPLRLVLQLLPLQDFIRQVCKPAYTNVFRDRDGARAWRKGGCAWHGAWRSVALCSHCTSASRCHLPPGQ